MNYTDPSGHSRVQIQQAIDAYKKKTENQTAGQYLNSKKAQRTANESGYYNLGGGGYVPPNNELETIHKALLEAKRKYCEEGAEKARGGGGGGVINPATGIKDILAGMTMVLVGDFAQGMGLFIGVIGGVMFIGGGFVSPVAAAGAAVVIVGVVAYMAGDYISEKGFESIKQGVGMKYEEGVTIIQAGFKIKDILDIFDSLGAILK